MVLVFGQVSAPWLLRSQFPVGFGAFLMIFYDPPCCGWMCADSCLHFSVPGESFFCELHCARPEPMGTYIHPIPDKEVSVRSLNF